MYGLLWSVYLPAKSKDKSSAKGNLTLPKIAVTSVSILTVAMLSNLPPARTLLKLARSVVPLKLFPLGVVGVA